MSAKQIPVDDPVVAGLLSGPNLARLAYLGLDGRPRVVPIWFGFEDGGFIMITGPKASKVPALQANGAVALTISTASTASSRTGRWSGDWAAAPSEAAGNGAGRRSATGRARLMVPCS